MELRLLRYFTVVAEELHFSRAAERLHMAQPPLSQQIRHLEEELGVQLLARTQRRVSLTEPGRQFLESARAILAEVDQAVEQVRGAARGEVGRLAIGMVNSLAYNDILPRVLRAYQKRCPAVAITLREMSTGEQVAALEADQIQVGFLRPPLRIPGLTLTPVFRETLVAVVPSASPLAAAKRIPLPALAEEPFILFSRSHGFGFMDLVMGACLRAGFTPRVAQEAKEIQTIIGLVAAGFGVSLLPETVRKVRHRGVAYLSLAPPRKSILIAAAHRSGNPSPVLATFLDVLETSLPRAGKGVP